MNKLLLNTLFVLLLISLSFGCKKDDKDPSKEYGNITVSISYSPSTNSTFVYTWGQTEVRLHKDGTLVATMYASPGNQNISFGEYEYGNYRIDCDAQRTRTNVNTGSVQNTVITKSEEFVLDSKNKSVSINF